MTEQEALQLLDNATAILKGTRQDHINIQQAIQILQAKIDEKPEKPKKK